MNYQSHRENLVRERQSEKERIEKEKELEIIKSCKTIKKPQKNVTEFCNRMYDEAKKRQIKHLEKKEHYENEEKEKIIVANSTNFSLGFSKNNNIDKNKKLMLEEKSKSKNKNNKGINNYNFQVHLNSKRLN
jgi:hypothetical protein